MEIVVLVAITIIFLVTIVVCMVFAESARNRHYKEFLDSQEFLIEFRRGNCNYMKGINHVEFPEDNCNRSDRY